MTWQRLDLVARQAKPLAGDFVGVYQATVATVGYHDDVGRGIEHLAQPAPLDLLALAVGDIRRKALIALPLTLVAPDRHPADADVAAGGVPEDNVAVRFDALDSSRE